MGFLTPGDFEEWVAAFNAAFGNADDLETVVLSTQSLTLSQLAGDGPLLRVVPRLIKAADERGWAPALARKALEARQDDEGLKRVVARIEIREALEDPNPYKATRMLGQPMVDRETFRGMIQQVEQNTVSPVLVIDGEPVSGKSYSIQFLTFIASRRGSFRVVAVDLERLFKAERAPLRADRVGRSIVNGLGLSAKDLEGVPEFAEEQEARWALDFCEWLTGVLARDQTRYCLVFDHFGKALLTQGATDMIVELSNRAFMTANLFVVLLGYERVTDLESALNRLVEHQRIGPIDPAEIRRDLSKFFTAVYTERQVLAGRTPTREEVQPQALTAAQNVLAKLRDDDPNRLLQLRDAVAQELRRTDAIPTPVSNGAPN